MYKIHGFQDKGQLLETLVKENSMTFFPEFNLLAATSSPALFRGPMSRETAIFNVTASEISSGEFFKGWDYVSDLFSRTGGIRPSPSSIHTSRIPMDSPSTTAESICCPACSRGVRPSLLAAFPICTPRLLLSKTPDVESGEF